MEMIGTTTLCPLDFNWDNNHYSPRDAILIFFVILTGAEDNFRSSHSTFANMTARTPPDKEPPSNVLLQLPRISLQLLLRVWGGCCQWVCGPNNPIVSQTSAKIPLCTRALYAFTLTRGHGDTSRLWILMSVYTRCSVLLEKSGYSPLFSAYNHKSEWP